MLIFVSMWQSWFFSYKVIFFIEFYNFLSYKHPKWCWKNSLLSFLNSKGEITAWRRGLGDLFNLARLTIFPISWSIMVGWNQSEYLPHITCRIWSHTLDLPHQTLHTYVLMWCTFHFTSLYIDYTLCQEFNLRFHQPVPITMNGISLLSEVSS